MKKLLKLLFLSLVVIFMTGLSCTKDVPLCEKNRFGTVTVVNSTGKQLYVDVTGPGDGGDYYGGDLVSSGSSRRYTMDPGTITVWAIYPADRQAGYAWTYHDHMLNQCDEYTYTWHAKKKGADVTVEIGENGDVNDTYKDTRGFRSKN